MFSYVCWVLGVQGEFRSGSYGPQSEFALWCLWCQCSKKNSRTFFFFENDRNKQWRAGACSAGAAAPRIMVATMALRAAAVVLAVALAVKCRRGGGGYLCCPWFEKRGGDWK